MYLENGEVIFEDLVLAIEAGPNGYVFIADPGQTADDVADILLSALHELTIGRAEVKRLGFKVLKGGLG